MNIDIAEFFEPQTPQERQIRADRLRESLLLLLEGRFPTEVTPALTAPLTAQQDPKILERWFVAALKIPTLEDFCEVTQAP